MSLYVSGLIGHWNVYRRDMIAETCFKLMKGEMGNRWRKTAFEWVNAEAGDSFGHSHFIYAYYPPYSIIYNRMFKRYFRVQRCLSPRFGPPAARLWALDLVTSSFHSTLNRPHIQPLVAGPLDLAFPNLFLVPLQVLPQRCPSTRERDSVAAGASEPETPWRIPSENGHYRIRVHGAES